MCRVQGAVCSVHSAVCSVQNAVCRVQCLVCRVHCAQNRVFKLHGSTDILDRRRRIIVDALGLSKKDSAETKPLCGQMF